MKRLEYIDTLRGFAIFLVTLGHVLENSGYHDDALYAFIYSFHMPLFFAISGYVCAYTMHDKLCVNELGGGDFVVKKFRFIMIPYFVWSLVGPFFFCKYNGDLNWIGAFKAACIDNTSFWFLPSLFGLFVSYAIYKTIREGMHIQHWSWELLVVIFIGVGLVNLQKFTHIDFFRSIVSYYFPFWLGVFMGQHGKIEKVMCDNQWVYGIALVVFCLIEGLFFVYEGIINKVARLVCGSLSIPILFHFFKHTLVPEKLNKLMCYIGKNTLPIYIMQFSFTGGLYNIPGLNFFYQLVVFSVISVLMIVLILLICKILEKNVVLRQALLGKK